MHSVVPSALSLEPLVGKEATAVLAAFSMGGDSGMTMESVAMGWSLHRFE